MRIASTAYCIVQDVHEVRLVDDTCLADCRLIEHEVKPIRPWFQGRSNAALSLTFTDRFIEGQMPWLP